MAALILGQIKKQTSSFLNEKYKSVRMAFTDVTQAELLAEDATNNDPCSLDAKTMIRIADASFEIDDYWRIVDVLHRRLYTIDWKQWRQLYKSLVLLEFLLTHGPEELAEEFLCDIAIIQELSTFKHKDEKGFDWGLTLQKKSERVLELLRGGNTLKQARLKALKITNEIQGFGNLILSSLSSSSPSSSRTSQSSFSASFSTTSSTWDNVDELNEYELTKEGDNIEEKGSLLSFEDEDDDKRGVEEKNDDDDYNDRRSCGFFSEIRSKFTRNSPSGRINGEKVYFRSLSDVDKVKDKKLNRQFSMKN